MPEGCTPSVIASMPARAGKWMISPVNDGEVDANIRFWMYRNYKSHFCALMAGKKEFSALWSRLSRIVSRYFRCLTASPGRAVGSWSWRSNNMVRGLISERSYPWTVEPAGLNGSLRHRLAGEGSGGELEPC